MPTPATPLITELIDKTDNLTVLRDRLAEVLIVELANQRALAVAASRDPAPWDLRIFTEARRPWEEWHAEQPPHVPIVNLSIMSSDIDERRSASSIDTVHAGKIAIDGYAAGVPFEGPGGSTHTPGGLAGALARDRAATLVRNILTAGANSELQLNGEKILWGGVILSGYKTFSADEAHLPAPTVSGFQFIADLVYNETSSEEIGVPLNYIAIDLRRAPLTGELHMEVDFDYAGP